MSGFGSGLCAGRRGGWRLKSRLGAPARHKARLRGLLWADRFGGGRFGIAIGASADRRKLASDDVETGGAWKDGRLGGVELRDYQPERENKAFAVNLDYRPARDAMLGQIALGRLGEPADIARAVVFLAGPDAGYITGETLHVNGGMYMA